MLDFVGVKAFEGADLVRFQKKLKIDQKNIFLI